ncbi:MAG TPA: hypothetical protein PLS95_19525 [Thermoanaerobaculales bacterium]|nr:hypothetical protein [Thermoanaerobaculales bacterium]
MGDLILCAGLFTGEPVEEYVVLNQEEVDGQSAKPQGAYFLVLPVTGDEDAEFQKRRGQDVRKIRYRTKRSDDEPGTPSIEFEPMEAEFSNEREIAALKWLAVKKVRGWRGIMLDNGQELAFSEKNLEKLASIPRLIRPVISRCYELTRLKEGLEEGN